MEFILYLLFGFFAFILVLRIFLRYIFPWILLRWVKRKQREFEKAQGKGNRTGDMNVEYDPKKTKTHIDEDLGEYVDYEDIDENPDDDKN